MNNLSRVFSIVVALFISAVPSLHAQPVISLDPFASGFSLPFYVTHAGDGSGRIFVVEQRGLIKVVDSGGNVQGTPYLDLTSVVSQSGSERGLLGLAFHPEFAEPSPNPNRGRLFVHYTKGTSPNSGDSIIAEYFATGGNPAATTADDSTARVVLGPVDQPESNHNGGSIAFGPGETGMLYIGLGDGGGGGDLHGTDGNGQNLNNLLGKILRIDVDSTPGAGEEYVIPPDNPFPGGAAPEIFAYGLRNPYRFSFDREQVGGVYRLYCGDVGQNRREEISLIENGDNLGWRIMEGTECFNTSDFNDPLTNCDMTGLVLPIYDYSRSVGTTVIGGYVYRGPTYAAMYGLYIFADYGAGKIFALKETAPDTWTDYLLMDTADTGLAFRLSSLGEDEQGELYVCDRNGAVLKIVAEPPSGIDGWQVH